MALALLVAALVGAGVAVLVTRDGGSKGAADAVATGTSSTTTSTDPTTTTDDEREPKDDDEEDGEAEPVSDDDEADGGVDGGAVVVPPVGDGGGSGGVGGGGSGGGPGGGGGGSGGGGGTPNPKPPAPPKPKPTPPTTAGRARPTITSIRIDDPVCPGFTRLHWKATDALSVDVSIDYPGGIYEAGLPASGSLEVPSACTGSAKTYFVTAHGADGATDVRKLQVTPSA